MAQERLDREIWASRLLGLVPKLTTGKLKTLCWLTTLVMGIAQPRDIGIDEDDVTPEKWEGTGGDCLRICVIPSTKG
jgi:hypothetical protein